MTCYFCGACELHRRALDEGWLPSFYCEAEARQLLAPVCPDCLDSGPLLIDEHGHYLPASEGVPWGCHDWDI